MLEQPDLFSSAPQESAPYQRHSATSAAAAQSVQGKLGKLQAQVLDVLRFYGGAGCTDEEVQLALGMNPNTQRPRRIELVAKGLVLPQGQRRTRSGRLATVWVAT